MNVVMQKQKGRVTIDKTMHVSGRPDLPSYNLVIELEIDEAGRRYKLVRVWMYARAIAILDTATIGLRDVVVEICKFDLEHFFRKHGKQRLHLWQGGRLTASGYGTDFRTNFGERDAPDHTGRSSNALCFFIKRELQRLEASYRTRHPQLLAWLEYRRRCMSEAALALYMQSGNDFCWAVLFYVLSYVDDFGLAIIGDLLFDHRGEPVIVLTTHADGSVTRVHQRRPSLYFDAAIGIAEWLGHTAPEKKRAYPDRLMVLLGVGLDLDLSLRYLEEAKVTAYAADINIVLGSSNVLPNGCLRVDAKLLKSLIHRLLHASETIPLGRAHLFHLRRAYYHAGSLEARSRILGERALAELTWWAAALEQPKLFAVPLASRLEFPTTGTPGLISHYGDASREYDEETGVADPSSGFGAWAVIDDTFCFIEGRWLADECAHFSINVLEFHTEVMGARVFVDYARSIGGTATHVHTFIDNTTAEHVAERGRTSTDGLNELNTRRQQWLVDAGVHQRTSRVASVFNDIADLLSRGDIVEALRFAEEAGLPTLRLDISPSIRSLDGIPHTW